MRRSKLSAKFLAAPLIILLACTLLPTVASAHVLKTDGDMGAVLHIKPDDDPIARKPVNYVLWFQPNDATFTLANCDCSVAFVEKSTTIKKLPLNVTTSTTSENTFTFPRPDVYTVQVTGKPKNGAGFAPFALDYIVRVGGKQATTEQTPVLLWIGLGVLVVAIVFIAYVADNLGKNKRPKGKS